MKVCGIESDKREEIEPVKQVEFSADFLTELTENDYFVGEDDNFHLKKGAPKELVEKMRIFRKAEYNDENVFGE